MAPNGCDQANGVAQVAVFAAEHVRGEGERGQQQQRVGEVKSQVPGAQRRLALRGQAKLDEKRAENGFNQSECDDGYGGRAREMAAHGCGECPYQQAYGGEEGDATGDAVRELDDGVCGGGVLKDGSVAERPVIAAACAGAGGADHGSPENDGDEIGEHGPGEAAKSGRGQAPESAGVRLDARTWYARSHR